MELKAEREGDCIGSPPEVAMLISVFFSGLGAVVVAFLLCFLLGVAGDLRRHGHGSSEALRIVKVYHFPQMHQPLNSPPLLLVHSRAPLAGDDSHQAQQATLRLVSTIENPRIQRA
jgi:hypothetical protein